FSQDVAKQRYASFPELMDYCRRSADPVGRLMLHLYGESDARNVACSDAICSALQLINFWQDVEIDFRKNRIYVPLDDMARFGVTEDQIAASDASGGWWDLMRYQIDRSRRMLSRGAPLAKSLPGRVGLEIDRKSTRLNSSHLGISYAVFCLKKKKRKKTKTDRS